MALAEGGSPITPEMARAFALLPSFAAALTRVGAMFIFAPFFGSAKIPKRVKALTAIALAFCVTANLPPVAWPPTVWHLAAGIAGELLFGLAMGTTMSLVFVGAQWAGEVIGQQLGFNLGQVFDPQFAGGTVISDMLYMLSLTIFLFLNGHHALMIALNDSFAHLPVFTAGVGDGALEVIFGLMTSCTTLAMKLSAPILATMIVTDLVLGFLSKTMPQLNIMSMGQNLRALIGMGVLVAGLVITSETMTGAILDAMATVRQYLTGGAAHG